MAEPRFNNPYFWPPPPAMPGQVSDSGIHCKVIVQSMFLCKGSFFKNIFRSINLEDFSPGWFGQSVGHELVFIFFPSVCDHQWSGVWVCVKQDTVNAVGYTAEEVCCLSPITTPSARSITLVDWIKLLLATFQNCSTVNKRIKDYCFKSADTFFTKTAILAELTDKHIWLCDKSELVLGQWKAFNVTSTSFTNTSFLKECRHTHTIYDPADN